MFFTVSTVLAGGALMLAYGLEQVWFGVALGLAAGLTKAASWMNKHRKLDSLLAASSFYGILGLAALGVFLDLNSVLLIAAVVSGLGAWDMVRFQKSLQLYAPSTDILQIERQHLLLLGITLVAGGILAVMVVFIQLQISFYLVLVLAVLLILALSLFIRLIQK
jgi:hypothetical protein